MSEVKTNLKFYNLGSAKIDLSKITKINNLDTDKPVKVSKDFNNALKSVIDKDIQFLSRKLREILNKINSKLEDNNIISELDDENIEDINEIISTVREKLSECIELKNQNKVGFFTKNKKNKKTKLFNLDSCINLLTKSITALVGIKNEYNKLIERKKILKNAEVEKEVDQAKEDPLERTISFYMNKAIRNK